MLIFAVEGKQDNPEKKPHGMLRRTSQTNSVYFLPELGIEPGYSVERPSFSLLGHPY